MSERGSKRSHLKVQQLKIHLLSKIKSQEVSIMKNKVYTQSDLTQIHQEVL